MTTLEAGQSTAQRGASHVATGDLLAAVAGEVRLLEKEIELMKLRMNEEADPIRKEMIRTFGSCLWRHKRALEKAQGS